MFNFFNLFVYTVDVLSMFYRYICFVENNRFQECAMHHCEENILHESSNESFFSVFYTSQGWRMILWGEGVLSSNSTGNSSSD